jgi:hypothetical protein
MIDVGYDRHEDVLYVALGRPRPDYCEEADQGILWRFGQEDDKPSGVTVIAFRKLWSGREAILARKIATFLRADARQVQMAVAAAVEQERVA